MDNLRDSLLCCTYLNTTTSLFILQITPLPAPSHRYSFSPPMQETRHALCITQLRILEGENMKIMIPETARIFLPFETTQTLSW